MRRNIFLNSIFFISLIFIDQFSKYLIRSQGGFYVCNPNISFGIEISEIVFWIFWAGIVIFLVAILYKKYVICPPAHLASKRAGEANYSLIIILILSGAISNIIDRVRFGCVIDFVDLKFWPVFNLADTFITIGVIMLIVKSKKIK